MQSSSQRGGAGKPQPDQHWHEHATCFRLSDRGLLVISSRGHAGIINTLKWAQELASSKGLTRLSAAFTWYRLLTTISAR
jgi:7,8-dihydropterin-6-yl-methyl-4-(beta-D-ribofuranosyl)aminobenzene 5'-phosphate synthase